MKSPIQISFRTEIIPLLIVLISFALGIYFYAHFPEQVITHWDFSGHPDGYSGKFLGAFGLPLMLLGMYLLFLVLPFVDPKKERYGEFQKVYHVFKMLFLCFLFMIYLVLGFVNLGYQIPVNYVVPLMVGLLMIIIGNFMGKIKNNWFIGIRTPWTLSSENVWNKTHRLGGWLFVMYGVLIIVSPFFSNVVGVGIFIFGTVLVVGVTLIYSYLLYRKEHLK